jgi:1-acyl-sn-glycerol-3-phosphate acyltransferase
LPGRRRRKGRGVLHSTVFFVWAIASTAVYGIAVILVGGFSRSTARWIGKKWCDHLLAAGKVRVRTHGIERIKPNGRYIVACNHASAFDIVMLISLLPLDVIFMAKKELFRIPIFGWGIRVLGHMPVDRSKARKARESITKAVEKIRREDVSLLIFPEGTRSVTGEVGEFKAASFTLALEAGVAVLPVLLTGTHEILRKKSLRIRPGEVGMYVGEPIAPGAEGEVTKKELCDKVREVIVGMLDDADERPATASSVPGSAAQEEAPAPGASSASGGGRPPPAPRQGR